MQPPASNLLPEEEELLEPLEEELLEPLEAEVPKEVSDPTQQGRYQEAEEPRVWTRFGSS